MLATTLEIDESSADGNYSTAFPTLTDGITKYVCLCMFPLTQCFAKSLG